MEPAFLAVNISDLSSIPLRPMIFTAPPATVAAQQLRMQVLNVTAAFGLPPVVWLDPQLPSPPPPPPVALPPVSSSWQDFPGVGGPHAHLIRGDQLGAYVDKGAVDLLPLIRFDKALSWNDYVPSLRCDPRLS